MPHTQIMEAPIALSALKMETNGSRYAGGADAFGAFGFYATAILPASINADVLPVEQVKYATYASLTLRRIAG